MAVHIGKKIEKEVHRQGIKITAFAARINSTRSNVYNIFKRESVNTELLNTIAAVLNVDPSFFYSGSKEYKTAHPVKVTEESQDGYETAAQLELQKKLIAYMENEKKASDDKIRNLEETVKKLEEKIKKLSVKRK